MAASYGSGGTSPPVIGRPLERVFEEAQFTGEVNLSGRTLKEYPKFSNKYDLVDTIAADLSKNRFNEVPPEVCEYTSMEKLNCYHNVIRSIPEAITQLQQLTHLNLSRNQLTVLPPTLCQLQSLEVLVASNNRLVSLPEEVGRLEKLMDLDVSCNEISHLPMQIGDLSSLRCLNVRRNHLVELPVEISKLHLRKMDISSNRIERIPTVFRKIDSLEEFILDHNPLMMPPAHVCTKGRQHIMKYLQMDEKKRGVLNDMDIKRLSRKSLPPQQTTDEFRNLLDSPESKWKRHTVLSSDSGYSTTDSLEKVGWAPSEVPNDMDEANSLAIKAAEAVKEQRHGRELDLQRRYGQESRSVSGPPEMASVPPPQISVQQASLSPPQNSSTPPLSSTDLEDEFTRELQRQKAEYERKKKQAEQLRLQREEEECQERRRAAHRLQEEQQRLLIERQKHEVMARQEEERLREEALRLAEEARIAEEARLAEEAARLAEEQRLQEEARRMEEARQREEQKPPTDQRKPRQDNKRQIPRRQTANSLANSSLHYPSQFPPPPPPLHEEYDFDYANDYQYDSNYYDENYHYSQLDWEYRKSQSMKEDRKTPNSTQYRRTASDTLKKAHGTHGSNAHVDNLNYINRNGVPDDETMSNNSTTPGASPIPSPVSTPMALSPRTISPATSNPSLSRLQSSDRPSPNQSPATRRARVGDRTTGVASPSNLRPATRVPGSTTTSRSATAPSTAKKNHPTPRSGAGDADRRTASSTAKTNAYNAASRATRPGKKAGKDGGTGNLSAASVKMLEEYKDADPNLTIRRQYEHQREENQQLEMLRQTIESRLKVTLPDNLTDALKDGVVLCHLANQIRPRSVVSVHVPSPAVPKLNMAKCRRNVENFLDACRKIGVDQEQICSAHDLLDEKGVSRVAITVAALVAIGTNPKQSAV